MFCQKCGNELKINEKFCSKCGTVALEKDNGEKAVKKDNTQLIRDLEHLKDAIGQFCSVHSKIVRMEKSAEDKYYRVTCKKNFVQKIKFLLLLWLGIYMLCYFVFEVAVLLGIGILKLDIDYTSFMDFIIGLSFMCALISSPIINKARVEKAKKKYDIAQSEIDPYRIQEDKLCDKEDEYFRMVPAEYLTVDAIDYIIKVLSRGSASTLPEAYNMCDDYLHKKKLESANDEWVRQQQLQTAYMKSIDRSSRTTAAASVANFVYNVTK